MPRKTKYEGEWAAYLTPEERAILDASWKERETIWQRASYLTHQIGKLQTRANQRYLFKNKLGRYAKK